MTRLRQLRRTLHHLRRRRSRVRRAIGTAGLGLAVVWALASVFLADWLLQLNRAQRAIVIAAAALALVWAIWRVVIPWWSRRETLIDVALLVERQYGIDSTVVAALQFESAEAARWGSIALEQATIDEAAQTSAGLQPQLGLPVDPLRRRMILLAATVLVAGLAAWRYPDHAAVFFRRLLLSGDRYPTRTWIEQLAINGQPVDLSASGVEVRTAVGRPVRLDLVGSGVLPEAGEAGFVGVEAAWRMSVPLTPGSDAGAFSGELPRLLETADCGIDLGDMRTETVRLVVVRPPSVELELDVAPLVDVPSGEKEVQTFRGLHQATVPEGSRVAVRIRADKPLRHATLKLGNDELPMQRENGRGGPEGEVWTLAPEGTPLASLADSLAFSIQVTDVDGLQLPSPLEGLIRAEPDGLPQANASALTQLVLPTAQPRIAFTAGDDHGLSRISVVAHVVRTEGPPGPRIEQIVYTRSAQENPRRSVEGTCALGLTPLKAVPGDRIQVTVQAVDYRGSRQGKSTASEPLLLEVTDERGIYAAMADADRESARQLETMIQQQIDVGEEK